MPCTKRPSARFLLLLPLAASLAPAQKPLADVIDQVHAEFRADETLTLVREIHANDRWFTTPRFRATAEYLRGRLQENGLHGVELLTFPADGRTQAGFWTMPLAWDAEDATLEIVSPAVSAAQRVLADYRRVPQSLCTGSGATRPEGVEAELVEWRDGLPLAAYRGKFVLTERDVSKHKWALVQAGAAGAVNAFNENPQLRDSHHWIAAWGDYSWAFTAASTPLPCFSITPAAAGLLRARLAAGERVVLRARAATRHYKGDLYAVTGLIPGTAPGQEVLMLGHTSEPGAQDNATGVAMMAEAMALLQRLIRAGKLPPPRRSIRLLAMPEMFGSLSYIARYPDRMRRTVAAICLDTPAGNYELANTEYTFYVNPLVAASFADSWIAAVAEQYFSRHARQRKWRWQPFVSGTDNYLGEPMIGVPVVFPYSGSGVHTHHNSEDIPDAVDPRSLRDMTVIAAAFVYSIAAAQQAEYQMMAAAAAARGHELVARAALQAWQQPPAEQAAARDRILFFSERAQAAVASVLGVAGAQASPALRAAVDEHRRGLARAGEFQAASLGRPAARRLRSTQGEADRLVVRRKRFGTIPLDTLPPEQREGYPAATFEGPAVIALWWCDGRRRLSEVIRLTTFEVGETDFDFVGYFRFLEKHGYVEILRSAGPPR
jgi:hypothetical protein